MQDNRKFQGVYRKKMTTGFNLLKKCVPGTKKSNRPDMLITTVKYIRELKNKVSELEKCKRNTTLMESTQLTPTDCETGMKRDSVPKITLHYYNSTGTESDCTDTALREPQMADPSLMVTGLSSLMETDISEPTSLTGQMVTDILEMADPVSTPMEDHSTVEMVTDEIAEWLDVNSEEEEEEELPEFNSVEELKQWLGL
jgi:alpha-L-arabinofuranosidase